MNQDQLNSVLDSLARDYLIMEDREKVMSLENPKKEQFLTIIFDVIMENISIGIGPEYYDELVKLLEEGKMKDWVDTVTGMSLLDPLFAGTIETGFQAGILKAKQVLQ